ncbi:MAG: cytochrome c peroxidase, partial [Rikenellaceae bacterium]
MKKKLVISLILLVVILAGCFFAISRSSSIPEGSNEEKVIAIMESNQCMQCHEDGVEPPFYGDIPVVGTIVKDDMVKGYLQSDLKSFVEAIKSPAPVNEAMLAKLENAMAKQTMPPLKYSAIHWSSTITDAEREVILTWVSEERSRYGVSDVAAEFANEPVRPIDLVIPTDSQKVALGIALFNDKRLSDDGTVSCATCHVLTKGGTDNLRYAEGVRKQFGDVNAPTVFNSVYNHLQFWDGRAETLAKQAAGPPENPIEMGTQTWAQICDRFKEDKKFVETFTNVYPSGVTVENITDAIAEYEKTLITPNCRFDKYLRGSMTAMTAEEIEGYNLAKQN